MKFLFFIIFLSFFAAAKELANGTLISQSPFTAPTFENSDYDKDEKDVYDEDVATFKKVLQKTSVAKITYESDKLEVKGIVLKPKNIPQGKKLPILVYNHGGNREYGKVTFEDIAWLNKFVEKGYLVIAPQYRGVDGGKGSDHFGGDDVDDIKNMVTYAKSLKYADGDNVFALGHSRGGMMTYLSAKGNTDYKAIAAMASECDLAEGLRDDPSFDKDVYAEVMPNYKSQRAKALVNRSSCYWAGDITTPVYILQGTDDRNVMPRQADLMYKKLQESGNTDVHLEKFAGGHMLYFDEDYSDEVVGKLDGWFKSHLQGTNNGDKPATSTAK